MSKPEFQYVTELHDHDVVLGRGSGPNDRQGNINFRSLCHEKKIAYIEATSRDKKGLIAEEIVATVHSRGGRFLKRLNAAQAKKADVPLPPGADAVYELADKKTILEKTKQTLRQNRADFVAKVEKEVGRKPVVGAYPIHQRKIDEDNNNDKELKEEVKSNCAVTTDDNALNNIDPIPSGESGRLGSIRLSALEKYHGVTTDVDNIDPIPLDESCGLDSLNHPTMGRSSATMLLAALFNSSELQPIIGKAQDSFYYESAQSGVSAMSIQDMSLLLCDAMDRQSSGSEMDSANMFQSILNDCSLNEDMADQLVDELVKDSKSREGTFNLTSQQKALLLQYEQERRRELEQQQVQEGPLQQQQQQEQPQQQQSRHPLRQFRQGGDNDDIAPSSVFSSLVRHYNNDGYNYDDELNQLSCLHEAFFEHDSDRILGRRNRSSLSAGVDSIEPANYMDESIDISYRAARDLNQALGGSSLTTMNRVGNTSEKRTSSSSSSRRTSSRRRAGSFDSEFNESMMSMSISDFDNPGSLPTLMRESSKGTPNEVKVRNHSGLSTSLMVSDLIAETEEDFHF